MGKLAKSFRDLEVYQLAFESAVIVHDLSKSIPQHERTSLTDQVRRSSRSVCTHIAEAWGLRRYPDYFTSKLTVAMGEANETQVLLDFAARHGYISEENRSKLNDNYEHVRAQILNMLADAPSWCRKR